MKGIIFLIVFGFGLFGVNDCYAQIVSPELFLSTQNIVINKSTNSSTNNDVVSNRHSNRSPTAKDSLYDYQIYQRYYWWPYYPGLCGYTWEFRQLDNQLDGQLAALGYLPQLIYFNCPTSYSYYIDGSYNALYWQKNGTMYKYNYSTRNSGRGKNYGLYTRNALISTRRNSIDRVVSEVPKVKKFKEETQSDIDQSAGTKDKSGKSVQSIEIISTKQHLVQDKNLAFRKVTNQNIIQGNNQIEIDLKEKVSKNYNNISEKVKNDFQLSKGTEKIYFIEKPKHNNIWENFRGIYYNQTSQNNKNQNSEKTYNSNNTQRHYSSGTGNDKQRVTSPKNGNSSSKVSNYKTRCD